MGFTSLRACHTDHHLVIGDDTMSETVMTNGNLFNQFLPEPYASLVNGQVLAVPVKVESGKEGSFTPDKKDKPFVPPATKAKKNEIVTEMQDVVSNSVSDEEIIIRASDKKEFLHVTDSDSGKLIKSMSIDEANAQLEKIDGQKGVFLNVYA